MPDALSLSRTELPEEIALAIEDFSSADRAEARASALAPEGEFAHLVKEADARYSALTAAILSRLGEAQGAPSGTGYSRAEPSGLGPEAEYPSRGWRPMRFAPKDGTWVWGEWPELDYGPNRRAPRMVAPMRWMAPDDVHVEHWCRGGRLTVGDDPIRWAPIEPPPAQETEARRAETLGSACEGSVAEGHAPALTAALARVERLEKALEPFAGAARKFACAIGPDGIDDGLSVTCAIDCRDDQEATLSTRNFSQAAAVLSVAHTSGSK